MSRILLGERYGQRLDTALRRLDLEPLYLPDNPNIDPRLAGHADLSVFRAGERIWLAPWLKDTNFPNFFENSGLSVRFPNIFQAKLYPFDAQLNLCLLRRHLIFAEKTAAPEIVNELTIKREFVPIAVRQGYTRCACCVVGEDSLMTADRGIVRAASSSGLQVLEITPGYVELPGFSYGFLGGASCLLNTKTLLFTGRLDTHPDRDRILRFLAERGINAVFLTNEPVFDIGSAVLLDI